MSAYSEPRDISAASDHASIGATGSYDPDRRKAGLIRLAILGAIALGLAVLLVTWDNPLPIGSSGFWTIVEMRSTTVLTIVIVTFCQAVATVIFHTATGNRILTPSIMGFDAIYVVIQTSMVFFLGAGFLAATDGLPRAAIQVVVMVAFATVLYGWLFSGKFANLHILLLIGVVLGATFGSLSSFMQRLLTPSEYDVLSARLFGSMANSRPEYIPWALLICLVFGVAIWQRRRRLDVLALGRETAVNLGVAYRREVLTILVFVAVLIAVSTTMVGPMTFFGFIVATISYQISSSQRHAYVLPTAFLVGLVTLLGAYFILRHIFDAGGIVMVIIELGGGLFFLVYLLRKGSL